MTDFLHTSNAPESVRRLRWFEDANDALVAMDITAIGLQRGRTVYSDQIAGDCFCWEVMHSRSIWITRVWFVSLLVDAAWQGVNRGDRRGDNSTFSDSGMQPPASHQSASYEEGSRAVDIEDGDASRGWWNLLCWRHKS